MPRSGYSLIFLLIFVVTAPVYAAIEKTIEWRKYVDPQAGTSVDFPANVFSVDAGPPQDGTGRQFSRRDERARLSVYTILNRDNETPRSYLRRHLTVNAGVFDYRRVTARFFVVSG
jgi:hypothetical protein